MCLWAIINHDFAFVFCFIDVVVHTIKGANVSFVFILSFCCVRIEFETAAAGGECMTVYQMMMCVKEISMEKSEMYSGTSRWREKEGGHSSKWLRVRDQY